MAENGMVMDCQIDELVYPEQLWRNGVFAAGDNNRIEGSFCLIDRIPRLYSNHVQLDHPAIAKICMVSDVGDGSAICGIERIHCSLRVWLEKNPRGDDNLPESYRNILRSIIDGLQHAHDQGMSHVALDTDSIVMVGKKKHKPKITRVESDTRIEFNNDYIRLATLIRSICGTTISSNEDISDLLTRCATPQLNAKIISRHPASWSDLMRQEFILNLAVNVYLSDSLSPRILSALNNIRITPPDEIYDRMVVANIPFFNARKMLNSYANTGHGCMRFCRDCYIHLKEGVARAQALGQVVDPNFSEAYISQKIYEFFMGFFLQLHREFVQQNVQWQW